MINRTRFDNVQNICILIIGNGVTLVVAVAIAHLLENPVVKRVL